MNYLETLHQTVWRPFPIYSISHAIFIAAVCFVSQRNLDIDEKNTIFYRCDTFEIILLIKPIIMMGVKCDYVLLEKKLINMLIYQDKTAI